MSAVRGWQSIATTHIRPRSAVIDRRYRGDEELDFIINYDIKYRIGREACEEE